MRLLALLVLAGGAAAFAADEPSELVRQGDWQLVQGHCSGCHSLRLVTQNRFTRDGWLETIRWMQQTQKLWQFDAAVENAILDYLARFYGPAPSVPPRRPPLRPDLVPSG